MTSFKSIRLVSSIHAERAIRSCVRKGTFQSRFSTLLSDVERSKAIAELSATNSIEKWHEVTSLGLLAKIYFYGRTNLR